MEHVGKNQAVKSQMRLTQRGAVHSVSICKKDKRSETKTRAPLQLQGMVRLLPSLTTISPGWLVSFLSTSQGYT